MKSKNSLHKILVCLITILFPVSLFGQQMVAFPPVERMVKVSVAPGLVPGAVRLKT